MKHTLRERSRVHHSDQGVQYASREYLEKLREHGMLPSMSRPANPYDNATCESFLRTLKREEIYASAYRDFEDLQERVEESVFPEVIRAAGHRLITIGSLYH